MVPKVRDAARGEHHLRCAVEDFLPLTAHRKRADYHPTVDDKVEEMDGLGRFGWAVDPEGNRFELWQPAEGC